MTAKQRTILECNGSSWQLMPGSHVVGWTRTVEGKVLVTWGSEPPPDAPEVELDTDLFTITTCLHQPEGPHP